MAADQAAVELQAGKDDLNGIKVPASGDGGDNVPEMKDGKMEHIEHVDAVSKNLASMPGIM